MRTASSCGRELVLGKVNRMNCANLTTPSLMTLTRLVEQRGALQAQLAEIDTKLDRLGDDLIRRTPGNPGKPEPVVKATAVTKARKTGTRAKRKPRGSLKAAVVALLKGAGRLGMLVSDVAVKLGIPYAAIYAWFYRTGKSIKQIRKVGEARYAWVG